MNTLEDASTMEERLIAMAERRGEPLTGSMELLPLCNMNCDMCYVRLSKAEMEAKGRIRTGAEWLELGRQMAQAGTLFLLLTGGEPLLHPDFEEIYLGLKKMGMILTINTNGTLLDEKWAAFFGEHKPRRINITLYGADNDAYERLCHYPGGFDRTVNAVRLLRKNGVDVSLGCSVTPKNVQDVPRLLEISDELGIPMRMDTYMMPAQRERNKPFQDQNRLLPRDAAKVRVQFLRHRMGESDFVQYRDHMLARIDIFEPSEEQPCPISCHAGKSSFTVNWQGLMHPCVVTSQPSLNVFEIGFAQVWKQLRDEFLAVRYCAKCSACALRPACRTCAGAAILETGDYLGTPEYLCAYTEETVRLLRLDQEESCHE